MPDPSERDREVFLTALRECLKIELVPWQQTAFLQYVAGKRVEAQPARRSGKSFFKNVTAMWDAWKSALAKARAEEREPLERRIRILEERVSLCADDVDHAKDVEREECAKTCDKHAALARENGPKYRAEQEGAEACAFKIRARGSE